MPGKRSFNAGHLSGWSVSASLLYFYHSAGTFEFPVRRSRLPLNRPTVASGARFFNGGSTFSAECAFALNIRHLKVLYSDAGVGIRCLTLLCDLRASGSPHERARPCRGLYETPSVFRPSDRSTNGDFGHRLNRIKGSQQESSLEESARRVYTSNKADRSLTE